MGVEKPMRKILSGVPATAFLTALARNEATEDPNIDFMDEYAKRFAELCPSGIRSITRGTIGLSTAITRSRIIDELINEVLLDPSVNCFVNLGAGFDARPYRLQGLSRIRSIEIDLPEILECKEATLSEEDSPGELSRVPCDLTNLDQLAGVLAEHCRGAKVLLLSEGLLTYFPTSFVSDLASLIVRCNIVSSWITDVMTIQSAEYLSLVSRQEGFGDIEMFGLQDLEVFESNGWNCDRYFPLPSAHSAPSSDLGVASSTRIIDGVIQLRRL